MNVSLIHVAVHTFLKSKHIQTHKMLEHTNSRKLPELYHRMKWIEPQQKKSNTANILVFKTHKSNCHCFVFEEFCVYFLQNKNFSFHSCDQRTFSGIKNEVNLDTKLKFISLEFNHIFIHTKKNVYIHLQWVHQIWIA